MRLLLLVSLNVGQSHTLLLYYLPPAANVGDTSPNMCVNFSDSLVPPNMSVTNDSDSGPSVKVPVSHTTGSPAKLIIPHVEGR